MVQYPYPEQNWAVGRMRKRGEQVAKMDRLQRDLPGQGGQLAEMDRAAGMGTAARGGSTGTFNVPGTVPIARHTADFTTDIIASHKDQLQGAMDQVAQGSMSTDAFKRIMKQLGWMGDPAKGEFTDPNGQPHRIEAEAK